MERHKRLAGREERGGIRPRSPGLAQGNNRKEAEEANGYEDAFHDTSRDKAEGEDFVYPLGDGPQHDGSADVGDDEEQLQERAKGHAGVGAGTDDVAGIVQHRGVEKKRCGDRGDIRDQEQYARNSCDRLRIQLDSFPRRGQRQATPTSATVGYPLHHKHDATRRTSEPTSQNSVYTKFREFSFYEVQ